MQVEGYEDLTEIGRGGYAIVYRAFQPRFDRQVAIKVLTNPGLTDQDRSRFEREGVAMGRLSWHPNIVVGPLWLSNGHLRVPIELMA